jgi:hypothetical protein
MRADPAAGLRPGQQVRARVRGHAPWGFVVSIRGWEHAAASVDTIAVARRSGMDTDLVTEFPAGAEIDAIVLQVRRIPGLAPSVRLAPTSMMRPDLWSVIDGQTR